MKTSYKVIGLMSGSSLDGLDIAYCRFNLVNNKWNYSIDSTACIPYDEDWKRRLARAAHLTGHQLNTLDAFYGEYLGNAVAQFLADRSELERPDFITSHGHTIYHEPGIGFSTQIGAGSHLAAAAKITSITDLRNADMALGGQGAPIVPIGDLKLFPSISHCLNLGGIANISIQSEKEIVAFDLCGCNQLLNKLAQKEGREYDDQGLMARSGLVQPMLLSEMEEEPFIRANPPKSLSNQWVVGFYDLYLAKSELVVNDLLATVVEHIARQVALCFGKEKKAQLLITGGGARNTFLVERILSLSNAVAVDSTNDLIDYKEAMVMAFFGLLRMRGEPNVLSSVTGARASSCGGAIYHWNENTTA